MKYIAWILGTAAVIGGVAGVVFLTGDGGVRVGSKKFTESVILGELVTGLIEDAGIQARHDRELGGTRFLWSGLVHGEVDVYPDYTGTIRQEIFSGKNLDGAAAIRRELSKHGIRMTEPLGFNNTYALGMKSEQARRLGIEKISDLRRHPDLVFGFSNEFMDRSDGWPGLRRDYDLPQQNVRGLEHHLAYRGLDSGSIDVTDVYSTDPEIEYYDLKLLEDTRGYFPEYEAVLLYRADLEKSAPRAVDAMKRLEERIPRETMVRLNARVQIDEESEKQVASDLLSRDFGIQRAISESTIVGRLLRRTGEHLFLVGVSLSAAVVVAIPLGISAAKLPRLGQGILGVVGILQTIPSLALLVFMIPLLGIGGLPAMAALFTYSLLPIVRNTHAGLEGIPVGVKESAAALGLPGPARLRLVEVPLASRAILAGIKTSAIINIGTATLGALIGAGGYGQPILTGIRLDDMSLILQGAVPAAVLALLAQGFFELIDRVFIPRGLRLKGE